MPTTVERAAIYEDSIIRVEDSPRSGTGNIYRLLSTNIEMDKDKQVKPFRKNSAKFATSSSRGKESMMGKFDGDQSIDDLLFLLRGCMTLGTAATPGNNAVWTVGVGAATGGTFVLIYNGASSPAIPYNASAAVVKAAIDSMTTIGPNQCEVQLVSAGNWIITFSGMFSTMSTLTASGGAVPSGGTLTATPVPATVATDGTTTLATVSYSYGAPGTSAGLTGGAIVISSTPGAGVTRWTLTPSWNTANSVTTWEIQKGQPQVTGLGMRSKYAVVSGMSQKWSETEATINGDVIGDIIDDPFTVNHSNATVTDLNVEPIDMDSVTVWLGNAPSGTGAPQVMMRLMDLELVMTGNWGVLKTLNKRDPGISAMVEKAPTATIKGTYEHDAQSQQLVGDWRVGQIKMVVFESTGSDIIPGYPYRYKWIAPAEIISSKTSEVDGVFTTVYEMQIEYATMFGSAIQFIIDTAQAAF